MDTNNTSSIVTNNVNTLSADDSSKVFGISLRGIIAILVVSTVCIMSSIGKPVVEPLYTLSTVAVAFYFGHSIGSAKKTII